jgi:hypothetical protein
MTGCAIRETGRRHFEDAVPFLAARGVTFTAFDFGMKVLEREGGLCVVEQESRFPPVFGMTGPAFLSHGSSVPVRVAGHAGRFKPEHRCSPPFQHHRQNILVPDKFRTMAFLAAQCPVFPGEDETGLPMIERLAFDKQGFGIPAQVLLMAGNATLGCCGRVQPMT